MTSPRALRLHIEELIIDGAITADRPRIARAIEHELGRLIAERGVPATLSASSVMPRLDGGHFTVAPGARPETVGRQVARSVYRGLSR